MNKWFVLTRSLMFVCENYGMKFQEWFTLKTQMVLVVLRSSTSSQKQAILLSFYDCECWLWMFVRASNRIKQHICNARLWVGQSRSGWCAGHERRWSVVDSEKQARNRREWRTTGEHKYLFAFVCSASEGFSSLSSVPVSAIVVSIVL